MVLGNKNDLPAAATAADIVDLLDLKAIKEREASAGLGRRLDTTWGHRDTLPCWRPSLQVCIYSISCKQGKNLDLAIDWLTKHSR